MLEKLNNRLDIVINCAGTIARKSPLDYAIEDWSRVTDVNLFALALFFQQAAKHMIAEQIKGNLLTISSAMDKTVRLASSIPYNASKAALSHLVRHLALEYAQHDIRVNTISPGWFVTEMTARYFAEKKNQSIADSLISHVPLKRIGQLDELLGAVLLLISPAGQYITGEVLRVDGGLTINDI